MKIVTKNYSLKNGKRSYLVYLKDQNDNSLECYDIYGDEERLRKEEELRSCSRTCTEFEMRMCT